VAREAGEEVVAALEAAVGLAHSDQGILDEWMIFKARVKHVSKEWMLAEQWLSGCDTWK
jgi:hypothetical protein